MRMLTTGDCADILNSCCESPGGFTAGFVRGQIVEGRLHARINGKGETRQRARIRVHPDDLVRYIERHHAAITDRAKQHPLIAA